ncbi:hypothetical protein R1sor_002627 [Riccia sorocarpa]|uniref:Reverse transcriptase zinc-binding domain-containing protein n=1 Tax=Riccia sorocarpa TaxID=122646 RepID=A0ABD3H2I1_9MARC
MLRFFHEREDDWMVAFGVLIGVTVSRGSWPRAMRLWNPGETLLARPPSKIPSAPTASGLLTVWHSAHKTLELPQAKVQVTRGMSVEIYLSIGMKQGWFTLTTVGEIRAMLRKNIIVQMGNWADWAVTMNANRPIRHLEETAVDNGLTLFCQSQELHQLEWRWKAMPRHTNCRGLIPRSQKWGKGNGICQRCRIEIETPDHLLWNCRQTVLKWRDYRYITEGLACHIPTALSFIEALDHALKVQQPVNYFPFLTMVRTTWLERNEAVFSNRQRKTPLAWVLTRGEKGINILKRQSTESTSWLAALQEADAALSQSLERLTGTTIEAAHDSLENEMPASRYDQFTEASRLAEYPESPTQIRSDSYVTESESSQRGNENECEQGTTDH